MDIIPTNKQAGPETEKRREECPPRRSLRSGFHGGTRSDFLVLRIFSTRYVLWAKANTPTVEPPGCGDGAPCTRALLALCPLLSSHPPGVLSVKRLHTAPHRAAATGHDAAGDNDAKQNWTQGHGGADHIFTTLLSVPRHERPRDHANTQTSRGAGGNGCEPAPNSSVTPKARLRALNPGEHGPVRLAAPASRLSLLAQTRARPRNCPRSLAPLRSPPALGPWDPGTLGPWDAAAGPEDPGPVTCARPALSTKDTARVPGRRPHQASGCSAFQ